MNCIINPVLPGFHPDPSILRVGEEYYIATSTFEWFPGILIYHSRNLKEWEFLTYPLTRVSQLNMKGIPSSCGIFAPCLSWSNGVFYLVYTIVKTESSFQDTDNYLVTATDITGPWSEPIYLNSTGFDPSLFHDIDGKKWLVNRDCDTRGYYKERGGILLREYDIQQQKLIGPERRIYRSEKIIGAEGPHLYHVGEYYYLLLAEGGTDCNHVATLARSKNLFGPYTCAPNTPFLTSREHPFHPFQKAGHASLVQATNGDWYIAHLIGRPLPNKGVCILGRETAIQKVRWTSDGWLELEHGSTLPMQFVPAPSTLKKDKEEECEFPLGHSLHDDFDRSELGYPYQTLRVSLPESVATLTQRPGFLRLYGRDSLHSHDIQSLVARRQQAFCCTAQTTMEYNPQNYHQTAGLICLYDTENFYYLYVTRNEEGEKKLSILSSVYRDLVWPVGEGVTLPECERIQLIAEIRYDRLQFFYSLDGSLSRIAIGSVLDYSILSDDWYIQHGVYRFTGAFIGLCCQDCYDRSSYADFDELVYLENEKI